MEEIIKIRVESNKIENKHTKVRINKHKISVLKDK